MSKFLGPIHYWLHNKITDFEAIEIAFERSFQSDLSLENHDKWQAVELKYGKPNPDEALDQVIDSGNIHGWLQNRIMSAETRFAHKFEIIKAQFKESAYEHIQRILETVAQEHVATIQESGAWNGQLDQAYKLLNNYVLEGMPCDHAGAVKECSETKLIWQSNKCLHKAYWETANGDVKDHYLMRDTYSAAFFKALGNIQYKRSEMSDVTRYELNRTSI